MFRPFNALKLKPGDRVELEFSPGLIFVVDHVGQPYVNREDGHKMGVNDGAYVWEDEIRLLPPKVLPPTVLPPKDSQP